MEKRDVHGKSNLTRFIQPPPLVNTDSQNLTLSTIDSPLCFEERQVFPVESSHLTS
jgi:hypothetical protein